MSFKTTTCAKCGNLFSYDDSTWSKKPERDGLFGGYLCSNCANQIQTEKAEEDFRRQDRERQETERNKYENDLYDERIRVQRESQRREAAAQRRREETQYKSDNPGDYECPNCLYITLKRNASRCPKCQGLVNANYWAKIQQREAQEEEKRRLEQEEWERTRPAREAAENEEYKRQIAKEKKNYASTFFWRIPLNIVIGAIGGGILYIILLIIVEIFMGTSARASLAFPLLVIVGIAAIAWAIYTPINKYNKIR